VPLGEAGVPRTGETRESRGRVGPLGRRRKSCFESGAERHGVSRIEEQRWQATCEWMARGACTDPEADPDWFTLEEDAPGAAGNRDEHVIK